MPVTSYVVSGATGLVGSALVSALTGEGHQVIPLGRSAPESGSGGVQWNPAKGTLDGTQFEGSRGVVHLAGESIAEGRWTESKKKRIRDSRVNGTRLLCETLASLKEPPQVLVCASAIGFYGDRGTELLSESSPAGTGFLAEVCQAWESAADPAWQSGIRTIHLRIGIVLSQKGGALAKMLLPFRLGLGGRIGSGSQYMSWISLDDLVSAILFCLKSETLQGAVNAVAPAAVTNEYFTRALGNALRRPTVLAVPALGARLVLGEMAEELLLASTRVEPEKLQGARFTYRHPTLEQSLKAILNKN